METNQIISDASEASQVRPSFDRPSSRGNKFAPEPLICESDGGQIVFAELAQLASARSREQARLFYQQGIQETGLVRAMRWREVTAPYLPEEIRSAEEIAYGRAGALREEDRICRAIAREERHESPDPFELDRLEARLLSIRPSAEEVRRKIVSAGERVLQLVKLLERIRNPTARRGVGN